jgi:hypothetical protein
MPDSPLRHATSRFRLSCPAALAIASRSCASSREARSSKTVADRFPADLIGFQVRVTAHSLRPRGPLPLIRRPARPDSSTHNAAPNRRRSARKCPCPRRSMLAICRSPLPRIPSTQCSRSRDDRNRLDHHRSRDRASPGIRIRRNGERRRHQGDPGPPREDDLAKAATKVSEYVAARAAEGPRVLPLPLAFTKNRGQKHGSS